MVMGIRTMTADLLRARPMKTSYPIRRVLRDLFIAAAAALGLGFAAPATANASQTAEAFIQYNIDKGIAILSNGSLGESARRAQFRELILDLADERRIAMFTLGPNRRGANEAELDAFVAAFRDYAIAVYESRLSQYTNQKVRVTGKQERNPDDVIVNAVIDDPNAAEPVPIAFRVLRKDGGYIVVDIQVVGVWLALTQKDEFDAYLRDHGRSIPALSAHLVEQTAKIRAGKATNGTAGSASN